MTASSIRPNSFAVLEVRDLSAAARWYRDVLGFDSFAERPGLDGRLASVQLRRGPDQHLMLVAMEPASRRSDSRPGTGVTFTFEVAVDVEVLANRAVAAGGELIEGPLSRPFDVREVTVTDRDGFRIRLIQDGHASRAHATQEGNMPSTKRRPGWDTGDWTDMPPVQIWPYDAKWPTEFERARDAIAAALDGLDVVIEHIGSTAVPGLGARKGIDILLGLRDPAASTSCIERLENLGYAYHFTQADWVHLSGRGHKLHLTPLGRDRWVRHLLFRDYLRAHPDMAAEYERLKRDLVQTHGADGKRYVDGKTAFVEMVLERARRTKL